MSASSGPGGSWRPEPPRALVEVDHDAPETEEDLSQDMGGESQEPKVAHPSWSETAEDAESE
eukprot:4317125-Alexandrium_andersonii.AAC.1